MTNLWKRLRDSLFAPAVSAPDAHPPTTAVPASPAPATSAVAGFPLTYRPVTPQNGVRQPQLFDPALKHFGRAFRPGDPVFDDVETGRRWAELRQRVADHVLRGVAESVWGDRLILRGSRLLKAWIGDAAREPGDLDWLVDPPTLGPDDRDGARLCPDLVEAVFAQAAPPGVELVRGAVATDSIWTYERAEGRRVVFPWRAAGLPGGAVQVDVVFRESLPEPDHRIVVPAADGGCVSVRAAGPAQSLAWKLLWLATDSYPQGKDLYDAVLLAERFTLPRALLERTFRGGGERGLPDPALVRAWDVDWNNFVTEYPWVEGTADDWLNRLATALEPTFAPRAAKEQTEGIGPPALNREWLTSTVVQLARGIEAERAYDRLPILADALQDAGCDDTDVLAHCRACGPHARGCWVVELVLGTAK